MWDGYLAQIRQKINKFYNIEKFETIKFSKRSNKSETLRNSNNWKTHEHIDTNLQFRTTLHFVFFDFKLLKQILKRLENMTSYSKQLKTINNKWVIFISFYNLIILK